MAVHREENSNELLSLCRSKIISAAYLCSLADVDVQLNTGGRCLLGYKADSLRPRSSINRVI